MRRHLDITIGANLPVWKKICVNYMVNLYR